MRFFIPTKNQKEYFFGLSQEPFFSQLCVETVHVVTDDQKQWQKGITHETRRRGVKLKSRDVGELAGVSAALHEA